MGSRNSVPRKITIDNPEDATTIKVTENVVSRLEDIARPAPASPVSPPPTATVGDEAATTIAADVTAAKTVYVTSHQIRNQIDEAIDGNNAYWENRIKTLREGYNKINSELKREYDAAVAEVNQSWGRQYLAADEKNDDMQSCKRTEQEVIQCYNSNRDRSLFCHEQVKNFNQCVSSQTNVLLKAT